MPESFLRRFYLLRTFGDPSDLEYDAEDRSEYMLYWARRYDTFCDSALHWSPDLARSEETLPDDTLSSTISSPRVADRSPTPDPRMEGRAAPSITREQADYWRTTQEMPTAPSISLKDNMLTNVKTEVDNEIENIDLGDSLSPTRQARIENLLTNMYVPSSPPGKPVKGELITPVKPGPSQQPVVDFVTSRKKLSPTAAPFTPGKRFNTTSVSDLESRQFTVMDIDLDGTIMVGDDALTGLNHMEIDGGSEMWSTLTEDQFQQPAAPVVIPPLSPFPRPPLLGPKRSRMMNGAEKSK